MDDYTRGQWDAFNRVLGFLNTLEDVMIDKTFIYKNLMEMYPKVKEDNGTVSLDRKVPPQDRR